MKITNIRVLNNFKVKLTNTKLSGVNSTQNSVFEQGTRIPVIITPTPQETFEEKYNRVFNYLINRYEPGWSAATIDLGRSAVMNLMGISSSVNPLIIGGTVENSFNHTAGTSDIGWFDPLTHPKDYAAAVRSSYKKFERARSPKSAKHKFIEYNLNSRYCKDYFVGLGGNAFFGLHPDFNWSSETLLPKQMYAGYTANYNNGICRTLIYNPYGKLSSPMNSLEKNWKDFPWLSDRYTAQSSQFDMYLLMQEKSTLRDLLSDYTLERSITGGVLVGITGDIHLNTLYRGSSFPSGVYTKYPSYNDYGRTAGGFSADQVLIGSPWIKFPEAITWQNWWGSGVAGICFNPETLILFTGATFPNDPPNFSSFNVIIGGSPMTNAVGLSFGYGEALLQSLNELSAQYGNSMEFIAHLGSLPYGPGLEMRIPFSLYKDPSIAENYEYFRWRLDASVEHWKEKFKSPIDGFAHVYIDSSSMIERTYHQWQPIGFTLWTNIDNSGNSYSENFPVSWAREQHSYTFGPFGSTTSNGIVIGVERFSQNMFKDVYGITNPLRNDQRRFNGDTEPRHWCIDSDIATDIMPMVHDMFLGQRRWGLTYTNIIWGNGVCGSTELGEIHANCNVESMEDFNISAMSAFPFFYNTFIRVTDSGDIKWKRVPDTNFDGTSEGVPWINDRRFRLFYLYPTMLSLNMSILDHFHDGIGYYNINNRTGWFDKSLGNVLKQNMEVENVGNIISDFPHTGRRTPTKPPQNFWTGNARTSEFELLYACMKGGITDGLDSLHFNELYEQLKSGSIETPDTSRTGFYRSLDFEVWAASWFPTVADENGISPYPSIVPLINTKNIPEVDQNYFRYVEDPGSTSGVVSSSDPHLDIFGGYNRLANKIPYERRVFLTEYWANDGPPGFHREPHYYFKKLADGTTYTGTAGGLTFLSPEFAGGSWEFGDTNPLRFLTPWAYENRTIAKQSFLNFLNQAKNVNMRFKYVHSDDETWVNQFAVGGPYLSRPDLGTTAALLSWVNNPSNDFKVIPDARQTYAIVNDSRFNGITSSITNRTYAQEFKYWYDGLTYIDPNGFHGACGASAESILSYYTNVNSRQDFKDAYLNSEVKKINLAWTAATYVFCQGDLKSKIIGDSLKETTGFEETMVTSSECTELNPIEAKYAVDGEGASRVSIKLPGYGHSNRSLYLYDYLVNDYGYPANPPVDDDVRYGKKFGFHPVSEGGVTFGNFGYQLMILNQKRIRGMLRSRVQTPSDGLNFIIQPTAYQGEFGKEYFKEDIFHHCLAGTNYFLIFNQNTTNLDDVNDVLVEWKEISGNKIAVPCDYNGATGGTVDRIDLYEAGRNCVISGAYTGDPNKRLWRISVPPFRNKLTKISTDQDELPETILIPNGSRGVWVEAPASYGKPEYESGSIVDSFFFGYDFNSPYVINQPSWFNKASYGMSYLDGYRWMKGLYEANIGNTSEVFYETSMFENYPLDPPNNPKSVSVSPPYNYSPGPTYISNIIEFKYRPENAGLREPGVNEQQRVMAAFNKYVNNPRKFDTFAKYKPDILEIDLFEVAEHPLVWRSNVQVMTSSGLTAIGHSVMLDRTPELELIKHTVNFAHQRNMKVMTYFKPILPGLSKTYYPEAKAITNYPQRYYFNNIIPRSIYNPEFKRVLKEVMQETVRPQSEGGLGTDALQWDFNFTSDSQIDFSDYALDLWAKHKGYSGYTDSSYIQWAFTENNFPFPDSGLTMGVLRGVTWMYPFGDNEGTATHDLVNNPNFTETQRNNIFEYHKFLLKEYEGIIKELALAVEEASHGNAVFLPANDSQLHRSDLTQHEDLIRFAQSKKTEHSLEPRGLNRLRPRSSFYTQEDYDNLVGPGASIERNPPISVLAETKEAEKVYADINSPDANTMFIIQYKRETFSDFKPGYSWHEQTSSDNMDELPLGSTGAVNDAETFNTLDYLRYPSGGWFFPRIGWGREDCIIGYLRGKYQKNVLVNNIFTVTPLSGFGYIGDVSRNDNGTTGDAYYNPISTTSGTPPRANSGWYRKLMYHARKHKEIVEESQLPFEFKKPYSWVAIHMPPRGTILSKLEYMGNFANPGFRYIKQHLEPDLTNGSGSMYTYKTNSIGQNFGQFYHPIAGCVEVCESNMIPYSLIQNTHIENKQFKGLGLIIIPHREFIGETLETRLGEFEASGGKVLYMDEVFGGTAEYDSDDPRLKGRFYDLDSRDSEKEKLLQKILQVGGNPPAFGTISQYEYDANNPEEQVRYHMTKVKSSSWYRYSNIDKDDSFIMGIQLLNDMNWMDDRKNGIGRQGANYSFRYNELEPSSVPNKRSSTNPKLNGVLDIDLWGYGPNWRTEYNSLPGNPDPNSGVPWPLGGATGSTASMFYPERELYWGYPMVGGYNGRYWSCILSIKLPQTFKIDSAHKFYIDQENEPNDIGHEKKAVSPVATHDSGLLAEHIAYRYDQQNDYWKVYVNNIGMHADVRFKISPK